MLRPMNYGVFVRVSFLLFCLPACGGPPTHAQHASHAAPSAPPEAGSVDPGPAQLGPGRYALDVLGMSCPKCISNIDLQMARIAYVSNIQVDMQHGTVAFTVAEGGQVDRAALAEAVADAGFTLAGVRATPTP
jgi:mercuric ion binding protein